MYGSETMLCCPVIFVGRHRWKVNIPVTFINNTVIPDSSLFAFSSSEKGCSPVGAKSLIETVVSLPFDNFTCAYWVLAWRSSASSTKASYLLFLTCFLTNILPGSLWWWCPNSSYLYVIRSTSESDVKDSSSLRLACSARSSLFLESLTSDSDVDLMTYKKGVLETPHHQTPSTS